MRRNHGTARDWKKRFAVSYRGGREMFSRSSSKKIETTRAPPNHGTTGDWKKPFAVFSGGREVLFKSSWKEIEATKATRNSKRKGGAEVIYKSKILLTDLCWDVFVLVLNKLWRTDVINLSYVCRGLRAACLPRIYRDFCGDLSRTEGGDSRLGLFLRSLSENPDLGPLIQHFSFASVLMRDACPSFSMLDLLFVRSTQNSQPSYEVEELESFEPTTGAVWTPGRWPRFTKADRDIFEVVLPQVLKHISSLGDLCVIFPNPNTTDILGLDQKGEYWEDSKLQSLRRVTLSVRSKGDREISPFAGFSPLDLDRCLRLFYLPSIEDIQLVGIPELNRLIWPRMSPPSAINLTTLTLECCEATQEILAEILSATPRLKSLSYSYCCDLDKTRSFFNARQFRQTLLPVKSTLKALRLSLQFIRFRTCSLGRENTRRSGTRFGIRGTLGSMREFNELKRLSVPFVVLMGMWVADSTQKLQTLLPRSLEELCLNGHLSHFSTYYWPTRTYWKHMGDFVSVWREHTPALKEIYISKCELNEPDAIDEDSTERSEFVKTAQQSGLKTKVIRLSEMWD